MNKEYLLKNVGTMVQLRAIAVHLDENDRQISEADDDWLLERYEIGVLALRNMRTQSVGLLHDDSVYSYNNNAKRGSGFGFLMLKVQTFVRSTDVTFEPVARPGDRLSVRPDSLVSEALLEASLTCHFWKNLFMNMHSVWGMELPRANEGEGMDVWDLMETKWIPEYTPETYGKFEPLFTRGLEEIGRRIDRILTLFHHVLPADYQAELVRASRQLEVERTGYTLLERLGPGLGQPSTPDTRSHWFKVRFAIVIHVLRGCAREAERRRDALKRPE